MQEKSFGTGKIVRSEKEVATVVDGEKKVRRAPSWELAQAVTIIIAREVAAELGVPQTCWVTSPSRRIINIAEVVELMSMANLIGE